MADRDTRSTIRARLLVVDDESDVRRVVVRALEAEGFSTVEAATGEEVRRALAASQFDLIVLDVLLAGEDGFELLVEIRRTNDVPVILLSGKTSESDRVLGLRLGADDYVVKPFSASEVVARVSSVLRRYRQPRSKSSALRFGELTIDTASREVRVGGVLVETTAREFDLLAFLAESPRQVFSREQLLEQVWGSSSAWQDDGTVTEHVRRLRRKLDDHSASAGRHWISTVRGVGYRFEP